MCADIDIAIILSAPTMSKMSEIDMNILHVKLHKQAYEDLLATRESASQAQVYLKMKRGEMAQRFANALNKPATRQRGKKKAAEGPLTPIPMIVGEQMLLEFQTGILDYQEVQAANLDIMHLQATERYTNLVSHLKSKLDAGFDTEVRDFYDLFGGGGVRGEEEVGGGGGKEGDGKGAVGGGQTGVFVREEEPEVNAPADLSEQGGGAGDEGGFRTGGASPRQGGRVKGSRGEHVVSAEREGQGGFTEPGGGGTVRRSRRGVGFRREGYPTRPAEGGGGGEVHTSGGFGPILTPIEDVISPPQQPPRKRARVPQRQPPGTGPGY